jgi:hypothetical protein
MRKIKKGKGDEMENKIVNARIESTRLGFDRGVFLTFWLHLRFDGSGQGAGGFILAKAADEDKTSGVSCNIIADLLEVVGVESWEDMPGKHIRAVSTHTKVLKIGNILKDKWFVFDDITQYFDKEEDED